MGYWSGNYEFALVLITLSARVNNKMLDLLRKVTFYLFMFIKLIAYVTI